MHSTHTTATKTHSPDVSEDIRVARAAILDFAERMVAAGSVTATSPVCADLVEHRLVVRDHEAPGFTVVSIAVVDGEPVVSTMDFDIDDTRALRHVVHEDGLGLTLVDPTRRPLVTYRIV